MTRKVSDLYSFIPATHRRNWMTDWDLWLFSPKQHLLGRNKGNMSQKRVRRHAHPDTAYQFIILHFTFLVFVFLQIDKINIYDRQTTMRNEIHLSKVFVTWVFCCKSESEGNDSSQTCQHSRRMQSICPIYFLRDDSSDYVVAQLFFISKLSTYIWPVL